MKRIHKLIVPGILTLMVITAVSCKKYLDRAPVGVLSQGVVANKAGADGILIGAYALLRGFNPAVQNNAGPWAVAPSNWVYGSVAADDAHKGSSSGDQPEIVSYETYNGLPSGQYMNDKWTSIYAGVQRANDVLRIVPLSKDGSISAAYAAELVAEARFLRAVFHLEAAKLWRNVPYVDESISYEAGNYNVPNTAPIWPKIEADLTAAIAVLPATQPQPGRANVWAAKSFLAKVYMFQNKFKEANDVLKDIIANGMTANGQKYALVNFADNFNPSLKNSAESVFAVQNSVHDNANGLNGNAGDVLNFAAGGPAGCCGFYQPSFSFVNAFKVDPITGLPLFTTYNDTDVQNDQGVPGSSAWSASVKYLGPLPPKKPEDPKLGDAVSVLDPTDTRFEVVYQALVDNTGVDPRTDNGTTWVKVFTVDRGTIDPRVDYSVGRRGIPYLDWGVHPGAAWVRAQSDAGPYSPIKNIYYQAAKASTSDAYSGWATGQSTANNVNLIRFADVVLWAAECEVEVGALSQAQTYVNMIRFRASNTAGWVHTYVDRSNPLGGFTNTPAANYKVSLYPAGTFDANGKAYAREAVRFERRLELGLEGHRFFDLQRYDSGAPGYMKTQLDAYVQHETTIKPFDPRMPVFNFSTLNGATFKKGKTELYPIPQSQIDLSLVGGAPTLKQNPGY